MLLLLIIPIAAIKGLLSIGLHPGKEGEGVPIWGMIFGFWNQSPQDLIDSMETLRQFFEEGLLDSAFWHKFTLTKHSTVYKEWTEGKHPELKIKPQNPSQFAQNDLHFEGEEKSQKYSAPLNTALNQWMHNQNLTKKVETYFPYKMPQPSIPKNYIKNLIQKYEQKRNKTFSTIPFSLSKVTSMLQPIGQMIQV